MRKSNVKTMKIFEKDNLQKRLIDLDECVINALNLFTREEVPDLEFSMYKRPFVVGSENAEVTGKILFEDRDALFADESNYKQKLMVVKGINKAVLISASGEKHAPLIAKHLKKKKIEVHLLTNNPNALAKKYADKIYLFPKNTEPYTYNTSTYMGMILEKKKEDSGKILEHIHKIKHEIPKDLNEYNAFFIILPEQFDAIKPMFLTKFDELFGGRVCGRVFTMEQAKHAKTVVPYEKELFISFGKANNLFGEKRVYIPLPKKCNYAALMAIVYYVIGQIQKQHPPYFKNNIKEYTKRASKIFGHEIKPIVE